MSNKLYNDLFNCVKCELEGILQIDEPSEPLPPMTDRLCCVHRTTNLYLTYIKIAKNLCACYDQMLHPQKRRLVRLLVDGVIGRTLELKDELVKLECREVQFFDNFVAAFHMVPSDVELPLPQCFLEEKTDLDKEKDEWIKSAMEKSLQSEEIHFEDQQLSVEEAVKLIQMHERARQGKHNFLVTEQAYLIEEEEHRKFAVKRPKPKIGPEDAAVLIQKIWRGYIARKSFKKICHSELEFLKMYHPELKADEKCVNAVKEILEHRYELQKKLKECYQSLLSDTKEQIETEIVPEMTEKLEDDIRKYFHSYKDTNQAFPTYPLEEEGGSLLFWAETVPADQAIPVTSTKEVKADKTKDKGGKEKGKKDEKEKGKKGDNEEEEGFVLNPSKFVPDLKEVMSEYLKLWDKKQVVKDKKKKTLFEFDPLEHDPLASQQLHADDPDETIVKEDLMKEFKTSVRQKVDDLMRVELAELSKALLKDQGKKKAKKGGKKKGGKKKGGKKGGGKKGKKEKDLTPDRSFESLIEELVSENILKDYPKVHLSEIIGSCCSFGSFLEKEYKKDAIPCIGDIKRVVKEVCILPMVSPVIHSKCPYAKSVLFAGPQGSGKKTFVYTICTEIGATLFDLSAKNIAGKYPGKQGLSMLMHLMSKVGRRVQPTVIYIEDAEKTFLKKVPKTDETDPKRLKKELPKFLKGIGADDRIVLIGTTRTPFDVDLKGLGTCYQKIFYLANPDSNCRRALWNELIRNHKGVISPDFDMTTLCKVSDGYTPLHIKSVIQKCMEEVLMQGDGTRLATGWKGSDCKAYFLPRFVSISTYRIYIPAATIHSCI